MMGSLVRSVAAWKARLVWPLAAERPAEKFATPGGWVLLQAANSTARSEREAKRASLKTFFIVKHIFPLHQPSAAARLFCPRPIRDRRVAARARQSQGDSTSAPAPLESSLDCPPR